MCSCHVLLRLVNCQAASGTSKTTVHYCVVLLSLLSRGLSELHQAWCKRITSGYHSLQSSACLSAWRRSLLPDTAAVGPVTAQTRLALANILRTHTEADGEADPESNTAPLELARGPYQVKAFQDLHNKSTHQHCHASLGIFVCSSHRRGNGGF